MARKPLSDNERLKTESNFLRGTILTIATPAHGRVKGETTFKPIRFHGMYEQDDRDIRAERAEAKLEPLKFMLCAAECRAGSSNRPNG